VTAPDSYEAGRAELAAIVGRLEAGGQSLEESLTLWERAEELADHCERWLDGARTAISAATEPADEPADRPATEPDDDRG